MMSRLKRAHTATHFTFSHLFCLRAACASKCACAAYAQCCVYNSEGLPMTVFQTDMKTTSDHHAKQRIVLTEN